MFGKKLPLTQKGTWENTRGGCFLTYWYYATTAYFHIKAIQEPESATGMTEQLEACEPIDDTAWHTKNRHAHVDPAVVEMLNRYTPVEDGTAFKAPSGVVVPVSDVCAWFTNWEIKNSDFRMWCRQQAIVESRESLAEYFGPTAPLLNFVDFCISWPAWFKAEVDARVNGTVPITDVFRKQLLFENEIGYDFMGSPYLFPTRTEVLEMMLPNARKAVKEKAERGKHAKRCEGDRSEETLAMANDAFDELRELLKRWREYPESVGIVDKLVTEAAEAYVRGEYDRMAIFEAHRTRVKNWADEQAMRIDVELVGSASHAMAVDRFALATMVNMEKRIEEEIRKYTGSVSTPTQRLNTSRLNELRAGSVYRP